MSARVVHALSYKDSRTYLRLGITPIEVVRLRWPNISDEDADYVLWEMTPFPLVRGLHDLADAVCALDEPVVVPAHRRRIATRKVECA